MTKDFHSDCWGKLLPLTESNVRAITLATGEEGKRSQSFTLCIQSVKDTERVDMPLVARHKLEASENVVLRQA